VWRVLRHLGVRDADLEDVAQDVFMVAFRRLEDFEGRSSVRVWLYGIALRRASEYRRKAHVRREVATETLPEDGMSPNQQATLETRRKLERLASLLEDLDEAKREAFVLYELEGLTMKEVAEAVGCKLQTAYARHRAARDHVREGVQGGATP